MAQERDPDLVRKLVDLVTGGSKAKAAKEPEAAKPAELEQAGGGAAKERRFDSVGFEKCLVSLLAEHGTLVSGKIHVVNLSSLQRQFGADWERIAAKATQLIERIIESRLGPTDHFMRYSEFIYIFLFPQLGIAEARLKATKIADEIRRRLLGESGDLSLFRIGTLVAEADGSIRLDAGGALGGIARRLNVGGSGPESPAFAPPGRTASTAPDTTKEGSGPAAAPGSPAPWYQSPASRGKVDQAPGMSVLPSRYKFLYWPVWNVQKNAVTNFICGVGPASAGTATGPSQGLPENLDFLILQKVRHDFDGLAAASQRVLFTVPVYRRTVANSTDWMRFLELCQRISPEQRRLLVFELMDLVPILQWSAVEQATQTLRTLGRAVVVRQPIDNSRFARLRSLSAHAVGFDLDDYSAWPESRVIAEMNRFAEGATFEGLTTYVRGLRSLSLTTAAICAGFNYIDGPAIAEPVDTPQRVFALKIFDLYGRQLAGLQS